MKFAKCALTVLFAITPLLTWAAPVTQKIAVQGMSCSSCQAKITKRLGKFAGVKSTDVNVEAGVVTVQYDDAKVKGAELTAAIERLGYKVTQ